MKPIALILCLPLMLTACAHIPHFSSGSATSAANAQTTPDQTQLTQYHWRLVDATDAVGKRIDALFVRADRPLTLNFTAESISIANSCNAIGGGYRVEQGQLVVGPLRHTMMACTDPALSALDQAIDQRLQGRSTISVSSQSPRPILTLKNVQGDTLTWQGEPTAETRYGGPGETVFIEVAAKTVPCGDTTGQCLQVRERRYDAQGLQVGAPSDWRVQREAIEGYTHEAGVRNVLRLKRYSVQGTPSYAYVLDMVVESEVVK